MSMINTNDVVLNVAFAINRKLEPEMTSAVDLPLSAEELAAVVTEVLSYLDISRGEAVEIGVGARTVSAQVVVHGPRPVELVVSGPTAVASALAVSFFAGDASDLPSEDLVDAMGELANICAGL
jgi:hypothetical protein